MACPEGTPPLELQQLPSQSLLDLRSGKRGQNVPVALGQPRPGPAFPATLLTSWTSILGAPESCLSPSPGRASSSLPPGTLSCLGSPLPRLVGVPGHQFTSSRAGEGEVGEPRPARLPLPSQTQSMVVVTAMGRPGHWVERAAIGEGGKPWS